MQGKSIAGLVGKIDEQCLEDYRGVLVQAPSQVSILSLETVRRALLSDNLIYQRFDTILRHTPPIVAEQLRRDLSHRLIPSLSRTLHRPIPIIIRIDREKQALTYAIKKSDLSPRS